MYSPQRSLRAACSSSEGAVADRAGDAALEALDHLLDLDKTPDSQATVVARDFVIPAEARRPDEDATVTMRTLAMPVPMMKGPSRILVGLPLEPAPIPRVQSHVLSAPRDTSSYDANARWIVAAIWAAALAAFVVLAALVTAAEKAEGLSDQSPTVSLNR